MKRRTILLTPLAIAAATAILPSPAHALQDLTIGARTGTLGHGAELVLITSEVFSLRAGAGLIGFDADITSVSGLADNRTGTLAVPRSVYTLGADLAVGNFRLGGGVLYKKRDPVYAITYADGAEIDIGNSTYTAPEVTRLSTTLVSESWAPYVLVGLGQHVGRGIGLFLDAGVAFLDEPGPGDERHRRRAGACHSPISPRSADRRGGDAQRRGRPGQVLADSERGRAVRVRRRPEAW